MPNLVKSYQARRARREAAKVLRESKSKSSGLRPIRTSAGTKRNDPCPCGSGCKHKKCCRAEMQPAQIQPKRNRYGFSDNKRLYRTFRSQYTPEQLKAEQAFVYQWGFNPDPSQLQMHMDGDVDAIVEWVIKGIREIDAGERYVYAVTKLRRMMTPRNHPLVSTEEKQEWEATLKEYIDAHGRGTPVDGDAGTVAAGDAPADGCDAPATPGGDPATVCPAVGHSEPAVGDGPVGSD